MDDLTPINDKRRGMTISQEPSPRLRQLLDADRLSADDVSSAIQSCPALIEDAKAVLPALLKRVEPAGFVAVRDIVGRRFATYPQAQRSESEWEAFWEDYEDALAGQPALAVEGGMKAWVRTDTTGFLPKPGQLLALVKAAAEPYWTAVSRANRLAKAEPPQYQQWGTAEERQKQAEEIRKLFAIKSVPKELDGETDDRGIK